ncbi:D-alanyl-D-alanine endopeptidase [Mycetohabitans sp. B5]|uniref:Murein-DD-endopeptidase n=1 Tax=Mycetohabitans endofungorum TaxID=417203 RepID=A0A2P5KBC8_9BURK|nr:MULTISPECIES: D-alanyl-D-alanine endopeptidase [Mycetohabitans]MCG1055125.1 D-alanyl-D-alanine endopeptidase [Mycetohabitans sp. B5]PPB84000.1 murein-DD-endopeptidase [Mycetohabitans endofungorum]
MKSTLFSSLKGICVAAFGTALSIAGSAVLMAALVAPANAYAVTAAKAARESRASHAAARKGGKALTAKRASKTQQARAARSSKVVRLAAAQPSKQRVSARLKGRTHHAAVRRVAYQPRPAVGAFTLQSDGSVALRSTVGFMVDQNTGEVLYDKNSASVVPIASITKLMTAMVVLDSKALLNERLTVTDEDRDYEKGTGSRLSIGSTLSREDMLHIALMASENRAAAALSRYYPGGRPGFIAAMNRKAAELGMAQTHFQNATGLTSQNVSSARDLAKMVNAAYQYPLIRQFSTDRSYDVFTGKRTLAYNSTNALVRNTSWDIGLQKTGFINEAGECLVMQATIHGRPVIMVLLDSFGKYSRFADAQRLRNWMDNGGVQRVTSAQTNGAGT